MVAARSQWLLRLMVLVMAFTMPLQAFASLFNAMPACAAAGAHAEMADGHHQPAATHDCGHGMDHGSADHSSAAHEQCGSACMGTCGACAHCPAGVPQFSTALEAPLHHLIPTLQHRPGDVPPEASLRPPRLFS